jgi:hypothetical protein
MSSVCPRNFARNFGIVNYFLGLRVPGWDGLGNDVTVPGLPPVPGRFEK